MVDPDCLSAAERHVADVDLVTAAREIGDDRFGVGALHLQFAAEGKAAVALQQQTQTIPIVFILVADPIGQGFVQS